MGRRYFVSNYGNVKLTVEKLVGEPECAVCGKDLILVAHHVKRDKVIVFLCPNHHQILHRYVQPEAHGFPILEPPGTYSDIPEEDFYYRLQNPLPPKGSTLKELVKEVKEYENLFSEKRIKRIPSGRQIFTEESKCLICGFKPVLDEHHHKDNKMVFLCPNHHKMVHIHLKDKHGATIDLEDARKRISTIEKEGIPHYTEISKEQFYRDYRDYEVVRVKEPKTCKKCGLWFYPRRGRIDLCNQCEYRESFLSRTYKNKVLTSLQFMIVEQLKSRDLSYTEIKEHFTKNHLADAKYVNHMLKKLSELGIIKQKGDGHYTLL